MAQSHAQVPKRPLGRTGIEVSCMGLGGYHLGSVEEQSTVDRIVNESLDSVATVYRSVYEHQAPLIQFLNSLSIPVPRALKSAAEMAINAQLRMAIERVETEEYADGTVIDVLQPGYVFHGRVLRPATVRVAAAPEAASHKRNN